MTSNPVTADELTAWLLAKGHAEAEPGYGHVTARRLAEDILDAFVVHRLPNDDSVWRSPHVHGAQPTHGGR